MSKFFILAAAIFVSPSLHAAAAPAGGFLWGVASASFQVEGAPADSDWRRWTKTAGKIRDASSADIATDFWNRYDEDFRLAAAAGLNAYRLSIAWERIQPAEGKWDDAALAHYEKIIAAMRARGLEPIVTLHHFVLPGWLADRGGLLAADYPLLFARYAERVTRRLAAAPSRATMWITINEPMVLVMGGYLEGAWPPGVRDPAKAVLAAGALAKAHIEAVRRMRALAVPGLKISIAKNWPVFEAAGSDGMSLFMAKTADFFFNRQFMTAIMTGKVAFWMPGATRVEKPEHVALPGNRASLDFIGINQYGRKLIASTPRPPYYTQIEGPGPKSDMGWEIRPESFEKALEAVAEYKLPVLVTENGVADASDKLRGKFLEDHLAIVARMRARGYPLLGYLHWSLTDNFEWDSGLTPRFGLVEIDYKTSERRPRSSYDKYRSLVELYGTGK